MKVKSLNFVYRFLFCCALVNFLTLSVQAQDDIDKLLKNGVDDGKYLLHGYLNPFMQTISQGLNQGWYNTGKPHKAWGVDLTATVSLMYFPSSDYFYHVDNSKLNSIELLDASGNTQPGGNAPTMFGPDKAPKYQPKGSTDPSEKFDGPPGIDLKKNVGKFLPVPMATLGFGLPKSIELRFRFCPKIDLGDKSTFNLYGIGVMHDVKQYIPGIKLLPFDLSVFVGYTHMQMDTDLSGNFGTGGDTNPQVGVFTVNSTTIQGVISKKVSVITVYGALGYNIAKSNLAMKGSYDFDENATISAQEKNPVDMSFAASGARVTGGVRLKLAVFTFHADYTLQKYSSLSAGFGISIR
jgi:hypothetical protein